jgi:hypothetical protein
MGEILRRENNGRTAATVNVQIRCYLLLLAVLGACRQRDLKPEVSLTIFRSADVARWEQGHVMFFGGWTTQEGKEIYPNTAITIECSKGYQCIEARAEVVDVGNGVPGVIQASSFPWEITSWDSNTILMREGEHSCGHIQATREPPFVRRFWTGGCGLPPEDGILRMK